jgi:hypothetical protein
VFILVQDRRSLTWKRAGFKTSEAANSRLDFGMGE